MSDKQKAFLSIFFYSIFSAAMSAVTKIGLSQIPPLSFAFIRFLLASIIVSPFIWKERTHLWKDLKTLAPFTLLASLNIIFFVLGIKLTNANISQVLYAAVPILVGLFMHFFFGEKLSLKKITGIIIGFSGVLLVLLLPLWQKGNFSGNLSGNILLGLAIITWALYLVLSKKAQKTYSSFYIVSIFIILTTIILFPFFLFESAQSYGWWNGLNFGSIIAILYVTIFGTIISYSLIQYSIKHGGAVFASLAYYLSPVFGFIIAFWLLGEQLSLGLGIGAVLALLGVYITSQK